MQQLDARADQLRHQRTHLPELADIAARETGREALVNRSRDLAIVVDDLGAEQAKVDADVEQVRARRTRDRDRMDQGLITNPKDLERMQHELESLERRVRSLEDDELEVMERLEEAQTSLTEVQTEIAAADLELRVLLSSRDDKLAEIDRELADIVERRGPLLDGMPEDLMALYERLRAHKNGVGAAALRARQCGGCQLSLDNAELGKIAGLPSDEVVRCEECTRILVRTSESGL